MRGLGAREVERAVCSGQRACVERRRLDFDDLLGGSEVDLPMLVSLNCNCNTGTTESLGCIYYDKALSGYSTASSGINGPSLVYMSGDTS